VKESRLCTGVVSTGSDGIKQYEIITIRETGSGFDGTNGRCWPNHGLGVDAQIPSECWY